MEWFSIRNGFAPSKKIVFGKQEDGCINRLWNCLFNYCGDKDECVEYFGAVKYILDNIGEIQHQAPINNRNALSTISDTWYKKWYKAFDVLEMFLKYVFEEENDCPLSADDYCKEFNRILEEEKSGYRFIKWKAVPITNPAELELLTEATTSPFDSVNAHFRKAIDFYADRIAPDYENSIKEAISAVEAMCCVITGVTGSQATLGKTLKKLKDNGVIIHGAMEQAFSQLYGYTSDADGIRHGGIDFANAPAEDAKYMLLTCSAFVNYLKEKHAQIGGTHS
jgi:hypothetical protein